MLLLEIEEEDLMNDPDMKIENLAERKKIWEDEEYEKKKAEKKRLLEEKQKQQELFLKNLEKEKQLKMDKLVSDYK